MLFRFIAALDLSSALAYARREALSTYGFALKVALLAVCFLPAGCVLKPIAPNMGFVVGSTDQPRFSHDEDVCEEQATRFGYPASQALPEIASRNAVVRRCLKDKGWVPVEAPTPSPSPSASPSPAAAGATTVK